MDLARSSRFAVVVAAFLALSKSAYAYNCNGENDFTIDTYNDYYHYFNYANPLALPKLFTLGFAGAYSGVYNEQKLPHVNYPRPYLTPIDMKLKTAMSPALYTDLCRHTNVPVYAGTGIYINSSLKNSYVPYGGYGAFMVGDIRLQVSRGTATQMFLFKGGMLTNRFYVAKGANGAISYGYPQNKDFPDRVYDMKSGLFVNGSDVYGPSANICRAYIRDESGGVTAFECQRLYAEATSAPSNQILHPVHYKSADGYEVVYSYRNGDALLSTEFHRTTKGKVLKTVSYTYTGSGRYAALTKVDIANMTPGAADTVSYTLGYTNRYLTSVSSKYGNVKFGYNADGFLSQIFNTSTLTGYPVGTIRFDYTNGVVSSVKGPLTYNGSPIVTNIDMPTGVPFIPSNAYETDYVVRATTPLTQKVKYFGLEYEGSNYGIESVTWWDEKTKYWEAWDVDDYAPEIEGPDYDEEEIVQRMLDSFFAEGVGSIEYQNSEGVYTSKVHRTGGRNWADYTSNNFHKFYMSSNYGRTSTGREYRTEVSPISVDGRIKLNNFAWKDDKSKLRGAYSANLATGVAKCAYREYLPADNSSITQPCETLNPPTARAVSAKCTSEDSVRCSAWKVTTGGKNSTGGNLPGYTIAASYSTDDPGHVTSLENSFGMVTDNISADGTRSMELWAGGSASDVRYRAIYSNPVFGGYNSLDVDFMGSAGGELSRLSSTITSRFGVDNAPKSGASNDGGQWSLTENSNGRINSAQVRLPSGQVVGSAATIDPSGIPIQSVAYVGQQSNRSYSSPIGTYIESMMVPPMSPAADECDMSNADQIIKFQDGPNNTKSMFICKQVNALVNGKNISKWKWVTPTYQPVNRCFSDSDPPGSGNAVSGRVCGTTVVKVPVVSPSATQHVNLVTINAPVESRYFGQKDAQGRMCCSWLSVSPTINNTTNYDGPLGTHNGVSSCTQFKTFHPDFNAGTCSSANIKSLHTRQYPSAAGCNSACSQ
jgi:hypothetical protein